MREIALVGTALAVWGCASPDLTARPVVLVSVPPQAWMVEKLAGEAVNVVVMVPPGANPTTYEPGIDLMRAAARAGLYVRVGHPHFAFEREWFERVAADNPGLRAVNALQPGEKAEGDPHVWTSPRQMRAMAAEVAQALVDLVPEEGPDIRLRQTALEAAIDSLDREVATLLAPVRGRRFFVFHAAWGYFAADYGLQQVAIEQGFREPSLADLESVIAAAHDEGVNAIFIQPQMSDRHARVVAEAVGAALVVADPLAYDWPTSIRSFARALGRSFGS